MAPPPPKKVEESEEEESSDLEESSGEEVRGRPHVVCGGGRLSERTCEGESVSVSG